MSNFKHLFETLQESLTNLTFVKLTLSKPLRKNEGLLNVYMRLHIIEGKQVFELKYRHATEEKFKQFSFEEVLSEVESLLLNKFRAATLFTLNEDLLVMVSKKKAISYRKNTPSFKNKLPEIPPQNL
ncbi:hypothetical protein JL193_01395 [Polaribacter batillariae]|uniref:Uncharacterized protein n=1 Tax=Polaribacter batillariae TaxID=2808900 RepID=A0ABX7SWY8_9FLAO|nr:hypothetical protein [Polaribacter batillariae]QTD37988.1 hypothetical protein JL193_01395 [Polaribacter batillariae]